MKKNRYIRKIKFLVERGFEVLDGARKFIEEFGELKINVEQIWLDGSKHISD